MARGDNALVRAVARAPATLRTKLLVAFAIIAALLVVVAVLGLRVLGQSNARVESLGTLQLRAATYQNLQTQVRQLRQLLALRVVEDPGLNTYVGRSRSTVLHGHRWVLVDTGIAGALSQLGPATNEDHFEFDPPPADEPLLEQIRADYRRFSRALQGVLAADRSASGNSKRLLKEAIDADDELAAVTDRLATTTRAQTDRLITQNRGAYTSSRNLFLVVGAGSVVLALALGLVLSWSLVGPIRRTESRLKEIEARDFSRHVEVPNRDELGALATNVNRMNDELSRVYDELAEVSRHKSEFLANMSHELRTPLNAIIGFSELLQQQLPGKLNEQQLEYVGDVLEAGRHQLALVNDILDLSKVEAGHMELELSDFSLRETLESGLTMQAERAARAGVQLTLSVQPDDIAIHADERRVRQVVFNLLSNAAKFTPAGGRIGVSARVADGAVEVAVSDTGDGIAPEDVELIFDEFRQARGASLTSEGTGLGLPLSRRLVELHGGRLWAESTPGSGSTFRFTLPAGPVT